MHRPHNRGSYYIKRKLHLISFYVQLTNIKLDQPYQTYQQLRTVGYFNHDHPITGILVSIGKQILPKQPELRVKMFHQANQINVDRMKSCQIALCLPHTMYGLTLSCFCMSSNTFYQPPKLLCPYPATVFSQLFGYQPTPCTANNVVLHKSAKQSCVDVKNSWIKITKRIWNTLTLRIWVYDV